MLAKDNSITCCCKCNEDTEMNQSFVTARLLYRIAFTVWHVALHIENEQVFTTCTFSATVNVISVVN